MPGGRARTEETATRINAAVVLLESGMPVAEAARVLAERFSCSIRQGRRYAERAAGGRVAPPEPTIVFTVKLPPALADQVRAEAVASGSTISALVARALTEFLTQNRGKRPRK